MDEEEIIEMLKEKLSLEYISDTGMYGEGAYESIKLKLNDVTISEVYLD